MPLYFGEAYIADPHDSGSFIITEANGGRSRGVVILRGGIGMISFGTVLGQSDVDKRWLPAPATSTDGSDVARAILWEDTDANGGDVAAGAVVRDADVYAGKLIFDLSVADPVATQIKWDQLAEARINVRTEDDPEARAENNLRQSTGWS
jgi:Bacteriophage lambda head decoration protein D